jgi:hypothetical protein
MKRLTRPAGGRLRLVTVSHFSRNSRSLARARALRRFVAAGGLSGPLAPGVPASGQNGSLGLKRL